MTQSDQFTKAFQKLRDSSASEPSWLWQKREAAIESFHKLGIPHTRMENWRYTDLKPVTKHNYHFPQDIALDEATKLLAEAEVPGLDVTKLVFVNGIFSEKLSDKTILSREITISSLKDAISENDPSLTTHFGTIEKSDEYAFQALNSALLSDGVFIKIAPEKQLDKPIHIVHINRATEAYFSAHPRNLIQIDQNSAAEIIETHIGANDETYLVNGTTEIFLEENARLKFYRLLKDSKSAYNFSSILINQKGSSDLQAMTVILGGSLVRNDYFVELVGDNIQSTVDGFYYLQDSQQVDNFTRFRHMGLNGESRQVFKGVLDDDSRGVFDGRIFVNEGAQKTDAVQTNRNLLLSDDAVAYAKPQLEIYADDVKCTHAATTGQIDQDQLFYLRSRGFSEKKARAVLTYAFAGELIENIEIEPLREAIKTELMNLLS